MAVPKTADKAKKLGYSLKVLTIKQAEKLRSKRAGPRRATKNAKTAKAAKMVIKKAAKTTDCSKLQPGDLCWEGDCEGGVKDVLYCNGTQGCTIHAQIPC
jgi:hypothetical protein